MTVSVVVDGGTGAAVWVLVGSAEDDGAADVVAEEVVAELAGVTVGPDGPAPVNRTMA